MKKLYLLLFIMAMIAVFAVSASAATLDLIDMPVSDENSETVMQGKWNGVLNNPGFPQLNGTLVRNKTANGIEIVSNADASITNADHMCGNYIGIAKYLKPNSTYTVTMQVKADLVGTGLYSTNYLYTRLVGGFVPVVPGNTNFIKDEEIVTSNEIFDTKGEYKTYVCTYKTGETVDETICIMINPANNHVVYNNNGSFAPGASYIIKSCVLEGDLNLSKTLELIDLPVATDNTDTVMQGKWNGVLNYPSDHQLNGTLVRSKTANGIEIVSTADASITNVDHLCGNYIGIAKYLKPNSTYTVTMQVKANLAGTGLYSTNYLYTRLVGGFVPVVPGNTNWTGTVGTETEIFDTNGEYKTYICTYKTGDTVDETICIMINPANNHTSYNNNGSFAPGASYIIKSCVLEGDLNIVEEEPESTAGKIELAKKEAGDESWDAIKGVWSGTLQNTDGKIEPAIRRNENGMLIVESASTDQSVADIWLGNYIAIADYVKPNTRYKLTLTVKFDSNAAHPLHIDYPTDGTSLLFDVLEYGKSSLVEASYTQNSIVINDTNGEFVTYTLSFTTPSDVSNAIVQVGPYGAGANWYWGGFTPGASIVIKSCVLEGDLVEGTEDIGAVTEAGGIAGENFSLEFFADVDPEAAGEWKIRFTFLDKVTTVAGTADESGLAFTFDGINPQNLADTIKAELILVDGENERIADTVNLSFKDYLVKAVEQNADDTALKTLAADILVYGGEAQKYLDLENTTVAEDDTWIGESKSTFDLSAVASNNDMTRSGSDILGASLVLSSTNRIMFRANDKNYTSIVLNGAENGIHTESRNGFLYIYTDELKATQNASVFTLMVSDGTNTSTVTYSVNAYIKSKYADAKVGALSQALYNYGASALAYLNT